MTQRPHCSHHGLIICCDSRSSILANNKHSAGPSALPARVILRVGETAVERKGRGKIYHAICGHNKEEERPRREREHGRTEELEQKKYIKITN